MAVARQHRGAESIVTHFEKRTVDANSETQSHTSVSSALPSSHAVEN